MISASSTCAALGSVRALGTHSSGDPSFRVRSTRATDWLSFYLEVCAHNRKALEGEEHIHPEPQ